MQLFSSLRHSLIAGEAIAVIYGKACQVENSIPFVKNQHLLTRFLPAKRVEINEYKFVNDTNNKG
ncbi:MAG: hypothetical protein ABID79_03550, partial [Elusimicrobiota bacterium]